MKILNSIITNQKEGIWNNNESNVKKCESFFNRKFGTNFNTIDSLRLYVGSKNSITHKINTKLNIDFVKHLSLVSYGKDNKTSKEILENININRIDYINIQNPPKQSILSDWILQMINNREVNVLNLEDSEGSNGVNILSNIEGMCIDRLILRYEYHLKDFVKKGLDKDLNEEGCKFFDTLFEKNKINKVLVELNKPMYIKYNNIKIQWWRSLFLTKTNNGYKLTPFEK